MILLMWMIWVISVIWVIFRDLGESGGMSNLDELCDLGVVRFWVV